MQRAPENGRAVSSVEWTVVDGNDSRGHPTECVIAPGITYVLDAGGNPQLETDFDQWLVWMQANDESLAETHVAPGVLVATRFTGLDQRRAKIGAPALWETMIFGGPHDLHQQRYTSRAGALKGHERTVAFARDQGN